MWKAYGSEKSRYKKNLLVQTDLCVPGAIFQPRALSHTETFGKQERLLNPQAQDANQILRFSRMGAREVFCIFMRVVFWGFLSLSDANLPHDFRKFLPQHKARNYQGKLPVLEGKAETVLMWQKKQKVSALFCHWQTHDWWTTVSWKKPVLPFDTGQLVLPLLIC